ncbi:MAG: hypothetical protein OEW33_07105 [Nitrospirota bacterium]|nr:hypothetical protein [Nitrospirota bacterium]MDH4360490.1 hypothetical protein [Nitrospirota bacterium]
MSLRQAVTQLECTVTEAASGILTLLMQLGKNQQSEYGKMVQGGVTLLLPLSCVQMVYSKNGL